ncbi:zf-HC2 domain-containing protein [Paenibacillus sp. G2S3]|uniref:zf-HC2 domain-containing protein n=1 Tax=Paenibacillus sp. G2S3 TaxID=3047872 RepID=UPI0024C14B8D|nr:zf-HC2 domain-containing protein [Paenibacillus sp. G2S3]WHY18315.1 zf-HC2 domain-containing protein [Paenibacillus sp. G2S3]
MKCAEVMEWMHRYLDKDLSQDEIVEMFRHIDDCPSCAEVFERLTLLSNELEQLPDVKPPFSLVDSILPQLAELDRSSREQSAVRTEEPVVVPFSRESSRGKPSKGTSIATRTGIGAIAAAVILGIAIFNMPDKMPGAEVEQMMQDSSKATSNNAGGMTAESQAPTSDNSYEAAPANSGTDSGSLPVAPDVSEDNAALDRAMGPVDPASMPTDPTENNAGSEGRSIPEPTNNVKPNPTERIMTPKPDTVTKFQTPDTSAGSNSQSKVDKKDQPASTDKGIAADPSPPTEESLDSANDFRREVMGFNISSDSNDSNVQTWTSPDGHYAVEFAGLQLVIYKNSAEGSVEARSAVTSYPLEGNWVSGEWSADSSQFTYVTEKDGVNTTKVYTVQETAAASSTPSTSPGATPSKTPSSTSTN